MDVPLTAITEGGFNENVINFSSRCLCLSDGVKTILWFSIYYIYFLLFILILPSYLFPDFPSCEFSNKPRQFRKSKII